MIVCDVIEPIQAFSACCIMRSLWRGHRTYEVRIWEKDLQF